MRLAWLLALVIAVLLVGAGCGGGDDEAADDTEITLPDTTEEMATDEETTDASDSGDDSLDFASEDCQQLIAAYLAIAQSFGSAASGDTSDVEQQAEIFSEFADRVPEEIRADMQTLAAAYTEYVDVIEEAGLKPGEIPSAEQAQQLQDALQSVGSGDVAAAGDRVSAWTQANC